MPDSRPARTTRTADSAARGTDPANPPSPLRLALWSPVLLLLLVVAAALPGDPDAH